MQISSESVSILKSYNTKTSNLKSVPNEISTSDLSKKYSELETLPLFADFLYAFFAASLSEAFVSLASTVIFSLPLPQSLFSLPSRRFMIFFLCL